MSKYGGIDPDSLVYSSDGRQQVLVYVLPWSEWYWPTPCCFVAALHCFHRRNPTTSHQLQKDLVQIQKKHQSRFQKRYCRCEKRVPRMWICCIAGGKKSWRRGRCRQQLNKLIFTTEPNVLVIFTRWLPTFVAIRGRALRRRQRLRVPRPRFVYRQDLARSSLDIYLFFFWTAQRDLNSEYLQVFVVTGIFKLHDYGFRTAFAVWLKISQAETQEIQINRIVSASFGMCGWSRVHLHAYYSQIWSVSVITYPDTPEPFISIS